MAQSDKLYRFYSKSQHILNISLKGRKFKVKFSTPYNGLARYSTKDESVASQIRKSFPFLNGMIKEEKPIVENVQTAPVKQEVKPFEPEKKNGTPVWMQQSVKVGKTTAKNEAVETNKTADAINAINPVADVAPTVDVEGVTDAPAADASGSGNVVQGDMFGIKLENVETYMEAKEYVRDVLGVDVTRKEEVKEYCAAHGIVFPKFSFD